MSRTELLSAAAASIYNGYDTPSFIPSVKDKIFSMTVISEPYHPLDVMYTRRRALALGAIGIGALSGCSTASELAGGGPIKRTAAPAVIAESAASESGYELDRQFEETLEQEVSAAGKTRKIIANNQFAMYKKTIQDIEQSSFAVIATPGFSIAGQTLNPVAKMSNEELVDRFGQRLGGLQSATEIETLTQTVLDTDMTISKFSAKGTFADQEIDVYAYLGKVVHEGDVVVAGGGYPKEYDSQEATTMEGLYTDIEHPA